MSLKTLVRLAIPVLGILLGACAAEPDESDLDCEDLTGRFSGFDDGDAVLSGMVEWPDDTPADYEFDLCLTADSGMQGCSLADAGGVVCGSGSAWTMSGVPAGTYTLTAVVKADLLSDPSYEASYGEITVLDGDDLVGLDLYVEPVD